MHHELFVRIRERRATTDCIECRFSEFQNLEKDAHWAIELLGTEEWHQEHMCVQSVEYDTATRHDETTTGQ